MPSKPSRLSKRRSNKKWCPVLFQDNLNVPVSASSEVVSTLTLCQNSNNTSSAPTATVIKAGNFKVVLDINVTNTFNGSGRLYVMFVPQGISVGQTDFSFPTNHPEWILCWRGFEPGTNGLQAISMQSKLKRNLNSGDRIVLLTDVNNYGNGSTNLVAHVTCSYVCCNN